jgi:hypothetical protein
MSFDLAVWHSDKSLDRDEARQIYLKLCEEWPYLEGSNANVQGFYQELIGKWPEIDTIPDDKVGNFDLCPWSCELSHSEIAVVLACVWSKASDVADYVTRLAEKYKLVLYDPQADRVHLPDDLAVNKRGLLQRLFGRR